MHKISYLEFILKFEQVTNLDELLFTEVMEIARQLKLNVQTATDAESLDQMRIRAENPEFGVHVFGNRVFFFQRVNGNNLKAIDESLLAFNQRFKALITKIKTIKGPRFHRMLLKAQYPFKKEHKGMRSGTQLLSRQYLPAISDARVFNLKTGFQAGGYGIIYQVMGYDTHNFNIPKGLKGRVEFPLTESNLVESGIEVLLDVENIQAGDEILDTLIIATLEHLENVPGLLLHNFMPWFPQATTVNN